MKDLSKKYSLTAAIAMVVGIVIGSGVFIKADDVLANTGGSLGQSLLAWFVGGAIMVVSAFCFATFASRVEKVNGVVDYVELSGGKTLGYSIGWYFATIYYPILTAILAFVSTNYFCSLTGIQAADANGLKLIVWLIAFAFIVIFFVLNLLAPKIGSHFQVSTTIIKLIPIALIAIVGTIIGLINGNIGSLNDATSALAIPGVQSNFTRAILATAFAYEGWIIATSINAEIKDSKKNLPRALMLGTSIIVVCYMLFYLGMSGILSTAEIINLKDEAIIKAIEVFVGGPAAIIFNIFIVISCLGTLNGLVIGCSRGIYGLAIRGEGPAPKKVSILLKNSNTSLYSAIFGLVLTTIFLFCWYLAIQKGILPGNMDELAIALLYASYFVIYFYIMKNFKDLNFVSRYVLPILACFGALFLVLAATGIFQVFAFQGDPSRFDNLYGFLKFAILIVISGLFGILFKVINNKNKTKENEIEEN